MVSRVRDFIYRMVMIFRFDRKIAENQQFLLKFNLKQYTLARGSGE